MKGIASSWTTKTRDASFALYDSIWKEETIIHSEPGRRQGRMPQETPLERPPWEAPAPQHRVSEHALQSLKLSPQELARSPQRHQLVACLSFSS